MKKNSEILFSIALIFIMLLIGINLTISNKPLTIKNSNYSDIKINSNINDPWALETNGSVSSSADGSDPWTFTGNTPIGYDFVSTAAGKNHTYIMTNNGTIWRHQNSTWNQPTWSKLLVAPPITSNGWVSMDISKDYIYILHADGDSYRIPKYPGWPSPPGGWVQSSNSIPIAPTPPLAGGETSFVSIAVDWNDSFCFILRNNGEVYRHECDNSNSYGPFIGGWTVSTSTWDIYQSYFFGPAPYKLEHDDGSGPGTYWGIPSTGWVSIDVYDNYLEPTNFSVYVLHSSGLVARHANVAFPTNPAYPIDYWMLANIPWQLDPRWNPDWYGPTFSQSTAFVSIACNDLDIFILQNDGEVFFIPEFDFLLMGATGPTWAWGDQVRFLNHQNFKHLLMSRLMHGQSHLF
ncbi:MAG: hypothetical protein EU549_02225 [Promethearchaeota archaeon]|nr:MAG: hypothetical protein EU549_02225 [Candidatus Lokiarchaeota archaeon]